MDKELLEAIRAELSPIKQDISRLKTLMEHDIPKQIILLAEGHSLISERLPRPGEVEALSDRVDTLEAVVMRHTAEISGMKKAL